MSNDSSSKCPQCGAALSDSALGGLCPSCLMALNLKTETVLSGEAPSAQAPLPPEQIAPHFPQLEILECLGRGGMGVVYKARQKTLNRVVALKLLAPERVGDSKFAERFAREAQALAALNHPNIVTVHDFGQAGGFYYLLMEFVDGVNLRQLLRTRKFTPEEALAIVPPLCDALQFAHERGIVHRDIKPENLLLDKAGRVKIADFGIAKMLDANGGSASAESASTEFSSSATKPSDSSDALTAGQVLGTRGYSAPEQMNAERVDSRADIYSLGVVFYEMLTGELPGKKIEPPSRKVQIDVRLDAVVLRALEKTPELRWQTAADLRTQVETIATGPLENEKAEAEAKPSAPPTKGPWQLVAVAIVFILNGCLSALNVGPDFLERNYNFDFGVLTLPMGIGLLRLRPWWRKTSIGSLLLVLAFVVFVVGSAVAGHPSRRWLVHDFSFNYDVSAQTRVTGVVGIVLGLGLLLLPLYVLMRADVKALFQRRGFSRPYIEWGALFAVLILSFGCAAVFNKANERGKLSGEIVSEMPRRPDRVRQIEDGRFVAQLPDNGSVELLAVHPHPATNSGWWKPDGSPSPFGSDIQTEAGENHVGGVVALVRVQWPNRYESWPRPHGAMTNVTSVKLKAGIDFMSRSGQRYFSGDLSAMYFEQAALFDDHATLFMGVATGEWRTLIVQKPGFLNYIFSGSARREWSFSETPDGNLKVTIRHLVENAQHGYRLVAVDVDGMEYLPNQTSRQHVSTDSFSTLEAVFSPVSGSRQTWHLPLNRVREVRWEFRPYETVEFRNVSMKPGRRTKVEILDFGDQGSEPTQISSKTNSTDNVSGFGPVMKCVVEECVSPDFKWFDLDTGKHFTPPKSTEDEDDSVFENWMRQVGADIGAGPRGLTARGGGFVAIPVKAELWDTAKASAVLDLLVQARPQGKFAWMPADETNSTPVTYVFKTREGGMGVLQILSRSEDPRGVKIRYKLVQKPEDSDSAPQFPCYATGQSTSGLKVKAFGDVPLGVSAGDSVSVFFEGHTLTITTNHVLFDGVLRAAVSATNRNLDVFCTNEIVSVIADRARVPLLTQRFSTIAKDAAVIRTSREEKLLTIKKAIVEDLAQSVQIFWAHHQLRMPVSLAEALSYSPLDTDTQAAAEAENMTTDQFELMGNELRPLSETNKSHSVLLLREKEPMQRADGSWVRIYADSATSARVAVSTNNDFTAWERNY